MNRDRSRIEALIAHTHRLIASLQARIEDWRREFADMDTGEKS